MLCCSLNNLKDINNPEEKTSFVQINNNPRKKRGKNIRSGTIILDFINKKVLIIQSYQKFWGLPKGHKENNESLIECAIRETQEETGIILKKEDLIRCYSVYNGDGVYYVVDGSKLEYDISKIDNKEEITGICWLCTKCLRHHLENNTMSLNSHLKILIPIIENELR